MGLGEPEALVAAGEAALDVWEREGTTRIALHQLGYAGLVTTNYNMLNVPEEWRPFLKPV